MLIKNEILNDHFDIFLRILANYFAQTKIVNEIFQKSTKTLNIKTRHSIYSLDPVFLRFPRPK